MKTYTDVLPFFLPGLVLGAVIAAAVTGRVARQLHTEKWIAYLVAVSVGAVLAATLPPDGDGFRSDPSLAGTCDFGRIGLAPFSHYTAFDETSLNVILFVPLGLSVGLLGCTPARTWLIVAAFALPLAIEALQSLAPVLGRGCQSGDVIDNLLGLGIGFTMGLPVSVIKAVRAGRVRPADRRDSL